MVRQGSSSSSRHRLALVLVAGGLIALVGFGIRSIYGLFVEPLALAHGYSREILGLAIALQNLLWGAAQPLAGGLADRFGPARVLSGGGIVYAAGVALTAVADTPLLLHLAAGVLVGLGLAGASFAVVIATTSRLLPPASRARAAGFVTAAGSLGQFVMAPLGQSLIQEFGYRTALYLLAVFPAVVPFFALALAGADSPPPAKISAAAPSLSRALVAALRHPSYLLVVLGFFVCGFHVAFIAAHLPAHCSAIGIDPWTAAWALGLIGLFNIAGSWASGELSGRIPRRLLLSAIYGARAVAIVLFLLLPPSSGLVLAFTAAIGILWFSTVPPTSALVAAMFGTRYLGTLFGIVFFGHQLGAFLGVWLGGAVFDRLGSYEPVWWAGVGLALFAALVHLPIGERPAPGFAREAAA